MSSEHVQTLLLTMKPGATGWIRSNCPFCESVMGTRDRRQSFGVNANSGFYMCHRCQTKGKVGVAYDEDMPRRISEQKEANDKQEVEKPSEYIPLWMEPGLNAISLAPARRYLRGRGYGRASWQRYGIGACTRGKHENRVIIPIRDTPDGKWLGWVGRDWTNKALRKYLYPYGMKRGEIIFQKWLLDIHTDEPLLVMEGIFDVLPYENKAIAVLGKPSHAQFEILRKAKRPLVIALDGDAWEEGYTFASRLMLEGVTADFVKLPPGKDPGDVKKEWLLNEVDKKHLIRMKGESDEETSII